MKKWILIIIVVLAAAGLGIYSYLDYKKQQELRYPKFYSGNGRFEATEIFVAAKLAGRVDKVFVKEGDLVHKGDKLVQMQTDSLEAEKAGTIAKIKVQQGELAMAQATVKQKQSDFNGAEKEFLRNKELLLTKAVSRKAYDNAETAYLSANAALEFARANVISAEGKLAEQQAKLQGIETDIRDSTLIARYDGRIQYLLAHEGEVVSAGGRVMNLVNLTDAYMTFFLPTQIAGQLPLGAEAKIVFDAAPDYPLGATITFIDPVAQFTPKSVETRVEREKLMFRVKAGINTKLLEKYISDVKTGLPGVVWVKVDPNADWKDSPLPTPVVVK